MPFDKIINIKDETVLITGASSRIGREIALYFAHHGYDVALHYNFNQEVVDSLHNHIISLGVKCYLFKADFQKRLEVDKLITEISKIKDLVCLVNNASLFCENSFFNMNMNGFDSFMEVNLRVPYLLSKAFFFQAKEKSIIINILDSKIARNETKYFDYLLSKKFLKVLTEQIAYAAGPKIRVNAIAPGIILPPIHNKAISLKSMTDKIPLKEKGEIDDIINSIDFLMKNQYLTGQTIYVDGGENLT